MSTSISIPTPLRSYVRGQPDVHVDGQTVGEALEAAVKRYPELRRHIFAEGRELRGFINVFLNETNVRDLAATDTLLREGDTLAIIPCIAGG